MLGWQSDGGVLLVIEIMKKILHAVIIPILHRRAAIYCGFVQQ